MKTVGLIVAGGKSIRFGGEVPKQFRSLAGRPMLSWSLDSFERAGSIDDVVVVVAEEFMLYTTQKVIDPYNFEKVRKVVVGGESRRESVLKGLKALPTSTDFVAIHDGARPLIAPGDIDRVVSVGIESKAAILAIKAADTIKRVRDSYIISTLEREVLYCAQTPQVFELDLILNAHVEFEKQNSDDAVTDDASLVERLGGKVRTVEPVMPNFKVTTAEDMQMAEAILKGRDNE